jgi:hypothetical protein
MEIYCKCPIDLDQFANALREIFNLRNENRTEYKREQLRVSEDVGGVYYLFEVCGLELRLMPNEGELQVDEMADFPFYITVTSTVASTTDDVQIIARHLATVLQYEGIEAAVESIRS